MENNNNAYTITPQSSSNTSTFSSPSMMSSHRASMSPSSPNTLPVATFAPLRRSHRRAISLPAISVANLDLATPNTSLDTNSILPLDYVAESAFYQVIDASILAHQPIGPPPAATKAIEKLPEIRINEDNVDTLKCCSICFDNFEVGVTNVVSLPCSHAFDRGCVSIWLSQHNTCPICRYELPTTDSEVEDSSSECSETSCCEDIDDADDRSRVLSRSISLSTPQETNPEGFATVKRVRSSRSSLGSKPSYQRHPQLASSIRFGRGSSIGSPLTRL